MARMVPETVRDFHGSKGEERVFYALRSLPETVTVIHSFRWLHPGKARLSTGSRGAQGEGDFVIFDPGRGLLVVEVKGGDVWCERGQWRQRNRDTGEVRSISPEAQASNTTYRIRDEIQARVREADGLLFGHAVWFPDGEADRTQLPFNTPSEVLLDQLDLARPEAAIGKAFGFWRASFQGKGGVDSKTAERVLDVLLPTLKVVRSVRQTLGEREERLVQLTHEQARVVEFLDEQRHAAIHGAAGTGKTMIALEKARRIASPNEPVLFLCYNAALRRHLERNHAQPNVRYATFHGLAGELIGRSDTHDQAEQALLAHLLEDRPIPYTHLVVDEGQDFKAEWLEYLAHRFRDGVFYVFYDRHQMVQGDRDAAWLDAVPCRLVVSRNCRNTDAIARAASRAAGLSTPTSLGVDGPKPRLHAVADEAQAIARVTALIEAACLEEKLPPSEIAVLTLDTLPEHSAWRRLKPCRRELSDEPSAGQVTLTTARRFKGLEASVVIVPDADFSQAEDPDWRRRLYVACSRARHSVHVVSTTAEADLGPAVQAFADTDKAAHTWRSLTRQLGMTLEKEAGA